MTRRIAPSVLLVLLMAVIATPAHAQESSPTGGSGSGGTATGGTATGGTASSEPAPPPTKVPADKTLYISEITLTRSGDPVDSAPVNSEVRAHVVLTNGSPDDATGAKATMRSDGPGVQMTDKTIDFGDIPAGRTGQGSFTYIVSREGCQDQVTFGGTLTSSLGSVDVFTSAPADCPGPRLFVDSIAYEGGDGDNVPEAGETLKVFVTLRNEGRDPATNISATASTQGSDVRLTTATSQWPDIAAKGTARSTTPFVIEVSKDAKAQTGCTGEGGGGPGVRNPDASTSSDGQTGTGQIDPGSKPSDGTATDASPDTATDAPAPDPAAPGPGGPAAPQEDPAVAYDVTAVVTAADYQTDITFGTVMVCMYSSMEMGGPGGPRPLAGGKSGGSTDSNQLAAQPTAAHRDGGGGIPKGAAEGVAALLMVVVGALALRYRFLRAVATK